MLVPSAKVVRSTITLELNIISTSCAVVITVVSVPLVLVLLRGFDAVLKMEIALEGESIHECLS